MSVLAKLHRLSTQLIHKIDLDIPAVTYCIFPAIPWRNQTHLNIAPANTCCLQPRTFIRGMFKCAIYIIFFYEHSCQALGLIPFPTREFEWEKPFQWRGSSLLFYSSHRGCYGLYWEHNLLRCPSWKSPDGFRSTSSRKIQFPRHSFTCRRFWAKISMLVDHRWHAAGACPGLHARVQAILNPNSSSGYSTSSSNVCTASFLRSIEHLLSDIKSISLIDPARLDKHSRRLRNFSECKAINLTLSPSLRF